MTATTDAKSVVQSFYANLAEGNPLADRNPYRGASQIAEGVCGTKLYCQAVHSWWVDGGRIVRFQQYADTAQLSRLS